MIVWFTAGRGSQTHKSWGYNMNVSRQTAPSSGRVAHVRILLPTIEKETKSVEFFINWIHVTVQVLNLPDEAKNIRKSKVHFNIMIIFPVFFSQSRFTAQCQTSPNLAPVLNLILSSFLQSRLIDSDTGWWLHLRISWTVLVPEESPKMGCFALASFCPCLNQRGL